MRAPILLAAVAAAVAACSAEPSAPEAAPEAERAPATLAGVDLGQPVRALGTEPFWSVELTGREIVYSGVDRPERRAPQPEARVQGTVATFAAEAEGAPLEITLTATECSDGMSDRTYPLTAIVKVGEETLTGCAASAAAIMNTGESGAVADAPAATAVPPEA